MNNSPVAQTAVQPGKTRPKTKPRRALFAALLSLILPGLGQLYNGKPNRASWFFLIFAFFSAPAVALAVLYIPAQWTVHSLTAILFIAALTWVFNILDAFFDALPKRNYVPKYWQGTGSYLLIFVACSLIILPLMAQYIRAFWVEPFRIPSSSMEPTLVAGDFIFADKRYNCPGCAHKVKRGDVVIFTYPNDRNINYIKRIIGLPGDRLQINGETLKINGKTLSRLISRQPELNVIQETEGKRSWLVVWKKIRGGKLPRYDVKVPPGQVFVMGDNRNASSDSRFFGTVPLKDIRAKARQVWMSYNNKLGGLRMDRAGKLVR